MKKKDLQILMPVHNEENSIEQQITKIDRNKKTSRYCSGIQIINPQRINEITKHD